jgi:GH15 family glucan-1,4-alpha-glucosidase
MHQAIGNQLRYCAIERSDHARVGRRDKEDQRHDEVGRIHRVGANMCTFWLVEALTRAGRVEEARFIFEKS